MESVYLVILGVLSAMVIGLLLAQMKTGGIVTENKSQRNAFFSLRNNYILVYALMMAGDWLQGPYVYKLYHHYGYNVKEIGRLFIAGYGSSMFFGTVMGSLADKHGRKKAALLYVAMYSACCATMHSSNFWVLVIGRVFGGISTSLLWCAFESWLVAEHFSRGFDPTWIGDTFSKAVFLGNGLTAIMAGLAASLLVDRWKLGPVVPFDAAIVVLLTGGAIIFYTWPENYGSSVNTGEDLLQILRRQFTNAWGSIISDPRVALLGSMHSLFGTSMYSFVFLWTPALAPFGEKIYHGMVFSCFMTACMVGSSLSGILMKRLKVETYMTYVYALASMALAIPFLFNVDCGSGTHFRRTQDRKDVILTAGKEAVNGISLEGQMQLVAFCVFEVVVGLFYPANMTLRSRFIPEETRSTLICMFRIPLNLFVCMVLYAAHTLCLSYMFALCSTCQAIAALLQSRLDRVINQPPVSNKEASHNEEQAPLDQQLLEGSRTAALRQAHGHVFSSHAHADDSSRLADGQGLCIHMLQQQGDFEEKE